MPRWLFKWKGRRLEFLTQRYLFHWNWIFKLIIFSNGKKIFLFQLLDIFIEKYCRKIKKKNNIEIDETWLNNELYIKYYGDLEF